MSGLCFLPLDVLRMLWREFLAGSLDPERALSLTRVRIPKKPYLDAFWHER